MLDGPHPVILVERQRNEVAGKGLVFAELKTRAAYRTVAIAATVVGEVEEHLDRFVDDDPEGLVHQSSKVAAGDLAVDDIVRMLRDL